MAHVVFSLNSTVLDLLNVVGLGLLLRCLVHGFWKPWPPVRGVSEALARRVRDAVSRKRKSDQRRSSNAPARQRDVHIPWVKAGPVCRDGHRVPCKVSG